ncbi:MAG: CZB domain-containing protein [Treponemataceae bacterium]
MGIDLNKAVRSHIQWKVKLRSAISNQEQLDVKNISSDCACEFGKWLHGKAKDTYKNSQTYIKCLEKHALFHTEAGKIALKINERKFAEAEAMLIAGSPFNLASNEVTNAVKVLKSSIVNV